VKSYEMIFGEEERSLLPLPPFPFFIYFFMVCFEAARSPEWLLTDV